MAATVGVFTTEGQARIEARIYLTTEGYPLDGVDDAMLLDVWRQSVAATNMIVNRLPTGYVWWEDERR